MNHFAPSPVAEATPDEVAGRPLTESPPDTNPRSLLVQGLAMGTVVTIEVVLPAAAADAAQEAETHEALQHALDWFGAVERVCSRFDPQSELRQLLSHVGVPVPVSPLLFEVLQFALALAERTGGAFDPTIGQAMEARGFNRHYLTGETVTTPHVGCSALDGTTGTTTPTYRDVRLDTTARTVTLRQPLVLDLGAVAKGLAIDLAARALEAFEDICVEAGGDLSVRGHNAQGMPWRIGVQHPRDPRALLVELEVAASGQAVCTSGDYERRAAGSDEHHLLDPRTNQSIHTLSSVTVIAPSAMVADGLATAAFVLGPQRGRQLLADEQVSGLLVTPEGHRITVNWPQPPQPPQQAQTPSLHR